MGLWLRGLGMRFQASGIQGSCVECLTVCLKKEEVMHVGMASRVPQ